MTAQMNPHTFDLLNPISVIGFLRNFKLACGTNQIHESVALWPFHFFMKKSFSAASQSRLASNQMARTRVSSKAKTTKLTTHQQVVNYLLRTYETDKNIADLEH